MGIMKPDSSRLKITEIFHSLQGEGLHSGLPTVFVRLTGCPLRCVYCDTQYAFHGGEWMEFSHIESRIKTYNTPYVCVTGGEPLAQKHSLGLMAHLCDAGYEVCLETSGAMDISTVDSRVIKVMDLKTPASGEMEKNLMDNLNYLDAGDQLKMVICDRSDYQWAADWVQDLMGQGKPAYEILFSPAFGYLQAAHLAQWILDDQLPVRFQCQLHKVLWGEEQGR